jgi:hypothetical protein
MLPTPRPGNHEWEGFFWLSRQLGVFGPWVQNVVAGQSIFLNRWLVLLAYCAPVLLGTAAFLATAALLAHNRHNLSAAIPQQLFRWSVTFALVSALATPVLVQDFWQAAGWGRLTAIGLNPYYVTVSPEIAAGIPINNFYQKMTWGPLWALISGGVMWVAGSRLWLAAALFKAILVSAWIGSLKILTILVKNQSLWRQSFAILIFGWLPVGVMQAVAEGHNDIVMCLALLFWLLCLHRGRPGTIFLALSVTVKYTSAPLFVVDILHWLYIRKQSVWTYLRNAAPALAIVLLIFSVFYRGPDFFQAALEMRNWPPTYSFADAALGIHNVLRIPTGWMATAAQLLLVCVAVRCILRFRRQPGEAHLYGVILTILCAAMFGLRVVWPWYAVWLLAPVALAPFSTIARWALGVMLVAPFPFVFSMARWSGRAFWRTAGFTLAGYLMSMLILLVLPKSWFPGNDNLPE